MRFILACAALLFAASPSLAVDFSKIRCEDPAFIEGMVSRLKVARLEGGRSLLSYGLSLKGVKSAKTRLASRNKLICDVSLRVQYRAETRTQRLTYTVETFGNGDTWETWK